MEYFTPNSDAPIFVARNTVDRASFYTGNSAEIALLKLLYSEKYNKLWNGEDWELANAS